MSAFDQIPEEQKDALQQEFIQAMKDSYVQTPEGLKMQEQGGWIMKNSDGTYSLERIPSTFPPTNNLDELGLAFPKTSPVNAIGTFHTHPVPDSSVRASRDDVTMAKGHNIPGLIMGANQKNKSFSLTRFDKTTQIQ